MEMAIFRNTICDADGSRWLDHRLLPLIDSESDGEKAARSDLSRTARERSVIVR
jgi:hypothetical protein